MKTRSTLSAAALLAAFSGLAFLWSPDVGASPDDWLRVRVSLKPGLAGSPSRTVAVRRPRLTRPEIRLLRSRRIGAHLLARIASRQQDRRAQELDRVSR